MESAVYLTKLGSLKTSGFNTVSTKAEILSVGPALLKMFCYLTYVIALVSCHLLWNKLERHDILAL